MGRGRRGFCRTGLTKVALALVLLGGLADCSAGSLFGSQPEAAPTPAPAPEPEAETAPPPVDIAGRWQLSAAAGGACFMTLGKATGSTAAVPQGTIAPEGGCPSNFFTSRKWAFEHGVLIIRDFKGRQLAQLSYLGAHFEGQDASGSALTLSKQM